MAFAAITAYGCSWAIQINTINTECSKAIVIIHYIFIFSEELRHHDWVFSSYWRLEGDPTPWSHTSGQHWQLWFALQSPGPKDPKHRKHPVPRLASETSQLARLTHWDPNSHAFMQRSHSGIAALTPWTHGLLAEYRMVFSMAIGYSGKMSAWRKHGC